MSAGVIVALKVLFVLCLGSAAFGVWRERKGSLEDKVCGFVIGLMAPIAILGGLGLVGGMIGFVVSA